MRPAGEASSAVGGTAPGPIALEGGRQKVLVLVAVRVSMSETYELVGKEALQRADGP